MFFAVLFSALAKALLWGFAENRLFTDKTLDTKVWVLHHFKQYHIWMAVFFGTLNLGFAYALANESLNQFVIWLFLLLWDTLMLDVYWWVHRFFDFTFKVCFTVPNWLRWLLQVDGSYYILLGHEESERRYGEKHRWHLRTDYDNYKLPWMKERPPLFHVGRFRCYWWWVIFGLVLVGLGILWAAL
jgi:hypothetical protein